MTKHIHSFSGLLARGWGSKERHYLTCNCGKRWKVTLNGDNVHVGMPDQSVVGS